MMTAARTNRCGTRRNTVRANLLSAMRSKNVAADTTGIVKSTEKPHPRFRSSRPVCRPAYSNSFQIQTTAMKASPIRSNRCQFILTLISYNVSLIFLIIKTPKPSGMLDLDPGDPNAPGVR